MAKRKSISAEATSSAEGSGSRKSTRAEPPRESEDLAVDDVETEAVADAESPVAASPASAGTTRGRRGNKKEAEKDGKDRFVGEAVSEHEAKARWPRRYEKRSRHVNGTEVKKGNEADTEVLRARRHYKMAEVDGQVYHLYDNAHCQAGDGEDPYICKIVEMFEAIDGTNRITCQWYYRAKDTPIEAHFKFIDADRVFISEIKDDNELDCLVEKIVIKTCELGKQKPPKPYAYFCDMKFLVPFSSFITLPHEELAISKSETPSTVSYDVTTRTDAVEFPPTKNSQLFLLDLYAGCGAMSLGLCLGSELAGFDLTTRWAVDLNEYACETLRNNHPETVVRNEMASDFLSLLKEWRKLCATFSLINAEEVDQLYDISIEEDEDENDHDADDIPEKREDSEIFEVETVLDICYGDPNQINKNGLYLKIRWKGYGSDEDTWEPIEGLSNCGKAIKEYVENGYKNNFLPLPGDVAVLCGGPPCQGMSGFNRFRNRENPLEDSKNEQIIVYMDIVNYLRPRFVLMENVVDLLKLSKGYLGRYALARLIQMNYQARIGMMAAGCYGLPQFRMRVFLWGALPSEILPQYPLPTHDVDNRGVVPVEFEMNLVTAGEGEGRALKKKIFLKDAISDLPSVSNSDKNDEMSYAKAPQTEFQRNIRLSKEVFRLPSSSKQKLHETLYDHRCLELNDDDFQRVSLIPKRKGANYRDLGGVLVNTDRKAYLDPNMERPMLKSGKPLVPDYAVKFVGGTSLKPFGRLWWDEIVPTVVTRAEPHNQVILHPEQDRVLTVRENARLQGFPDYYKLYGPTKERYMQVGNAVAVPVARALGYCLGHSFGGSVGIHPLFILPEKFPIIENFPLDSSESEN
uniref:DNA (cytosine-5-)-methyltransferase n=1 Tax=Kalanchoe fedtschenkoi TaxID=63787 RepID=A0A7N0TGQ3_KALFE